MLEEVIQNFNKQLEYEPEIQNADSLITGLKRFVVCGMGGSNLAAGIIKGWKPELDVVVHRDFGLPATSEGRLVIISSYSGNTAETISSFEEARARKLPVMVISTGGKLLELAEAQNVLYIQLPDSNSQPRFAVGLSIKATLKAMGEEAMLGDIGPLAETFRPDDYKKVGEDLADALKNKMPLIYSSRRNRGLAYFWKINFNETCKLPAFFNTFPELDHNEMMGFDSKIFAGKLSHKFAFVFINDLGDAPEIRERMSVAAKMFKDRGFAVLNVDVADSPPYSESFGVVLTALWTACYLSKESGVDPGDISMIEDFKKRTA